MKAITVSELKANVAKIVDQALAGEPSLIFHNRKFAVLQTIEVMADDTKLHQQWIDEAFGSGPAEEKSEADWQALKRRALAKRK